jgi:hypothetical protein
MGSPGEGPAPSGLKRIEFLTVLDDTEVVPPMCHYRSGSCAYATILITIFEALIFDRMDRIGRIETKCIAPAEPNTESIL